MDVADSREEVVLNLEIQRPDVPCEQSIARGEVDCRFDLVCGPARRHSPRVRPRQWKGSFLHAMRQLKDNAERGALDQRCSEVKDQYGPQWMEEQRDRQRQRKKEYLAAKENCKVPPLGCANRRPATRPRAKSRKSS